MSEIKELTKQIKEFNAARDWHKFHTPKNLAGSVVVEAAELYQLYQWLGDSEECPRIDRISEELADVAIYLFNLADREGVDLARAIKDKIKANGDKYPVEKCKGSAKKYNEL